MNWTTEKPTTPGWYAWRVNGEINAYLAKLYDYNGKLVADLDAVCLHSTRHIVADMAQREWFYVGPL